MTVTILLILAVAIALLGYRFFGKLLQLASFGDSGTTPGDSFQYSQPVTESTPEARIADSPAPYPMVQMLHQALALAGLGTVFGAMLGVYWGWVPSYLWILAGTLLGGAVYGMAGVWFGSCYPGVDLVSRCGRRGHPVLAIALNSLVLLLSLLLAVGALWTAATLLSRYPGVILPLLIMLLLARGFSRRPGIIAGALHLIIPASIIACLAVWWLGTLPVSFSGALTLDIAGKTGGSAGAYTAWVVLLALIAYPVMRRETARYARPRAIVFAGPTLLLLLAVLVGLVVQQPVLTAPDFRADPAWPGFPWLSIILVGSVLTGLHALVTHSLTARDTATADVRTIGFGAALINGAVALLALFAGATLAGEHHSWATVYNDWGTLLSQPAMLLTRLIDAWSGNLLVLGVSPVFASTAIVLVLAGLAIVTLDTLLRLCEQRLAYLTTYSYSKLLLPLCGPARRRRRLTLLLVLLPALVPGGKVMGWLMLTGVLQQWLGLALLTLLALWLRDRQRWFWPLLLPAAVLALSLLTTAIGGVVRHAQGGQWSWFAAHLGLLLLTGLTVLLLVRARNSGGQAMPTEPRA